MTIAMCYVSPEGVVMGADSTSTYGLAGGAHYFNHAQKVFEVGNSGTLGIVTWGLGGLGEISYRTLIAEFADDLAAHPPGDVLDAMTRWIARFWAATQSAIATRADFAGPVAHCRLLEAKPPFDPAANPPNPAARTLDEEVEYQELRRQLTVGFCIGGRVDGNRNPAARFVHFDLSQTAPPTCTEIAMHSYRFFGAPNMVMRLIYGMDDDVAHSIVTSPHWTGTFADFQSVVEPHKLQQPVMPLRDVVDFVYSCINTTIKALKFSQWSQVCGGPVEVAVISTDRPFRWVRHKGWDAAVVDGARP